MGIGVLGVHRQQAGGLHHKGIGKITNFSIHFHSDIGALKLGRGEGTDGQALTRQR